MRIILIWVLGFLNRRGLKLIRNFKPQSQACQIFEAHFLEVVKLFFTFFFVENHSHLGSSAHKKRVSYAHHENTLIK